MNCLTLPRLSSRETTPSLPVQPSSEVFESRNLRLKAHGPHKVALPCATALCRHRLWAFIEVLEAGVDLPQAAGAIKAHGAGLRVLSGF